MTSSDTVLVEAPGEDGVAVVTLNRPEAFNAANEEMHSRIAGVWGDLAALPGLRAVVLTGAGAAFSAGGDLPFLDLIIGDQSARSRIIQGEAATIVRSIVSFPHPVVAAVNGPAVGLGCSLASMADLVVMAEDAYFADPHVAIGLVAGDGAAMTWPLNIGLQRAKEWMLLGGEMSAKQALEYGLANRVVPTDQVLTEAGALAGRLAALPPQALRETRRVLNQPLLARVDAVLDDVLAAEAASFGEPAFQAWLASIRG